VPPSSDKCIDFKIKVSANCPECKMSGYLLPDDCYQKKGSTLFIAFDSVSFMSGHFHPDPEVKG
jgi:hypothetical protein